MAMARLFIDANGARVACSVLDRDGQLPIRCLIVNEHIGQRVTVELARLLAASDPETVRQRSAAHPYWTPVHLFCANSAALSAELIALLCPRPPGAIKRP